MHYTASYGYGVSISPIHFIQSAGGIFYDGQIKPLTLLFDKSLNEGVIPDDWRKAIVSPIFKKGNKKDPSNYRPVSLTSVVCKLCEKLIRERLTVHMISNKICADAQYGFMSGRSCVIQLLEIFDEWAHMQDSGVPIDIIYLDFAKAFDCVSHGLLLFKLKKLGIVGQLFNWVKDFLHNRTQCVRVGSSVSSWADVVSGVPQGNVLGPILFLCFINDLPDVVSGIVKTFADDTKLYSQVPNIEESENLLVDLDKLCDWSEKWKLSFNADKCMVMHIGSNESMTNEKDLGITFDNKLNFDQHISKF